MRSCIVFSLNIESSTEYMEHQATLEYVLDQVKMSCKAVM